MIQNYFFKPPDMYFSFAICIAIIEASLLVVERCFEVKLLVEYYQQQQYAWFGLTIAFLCMPGVIYVNLIFGNREFELLSTLKGYFFPLAIVMWYGKLITITRITFNFIKS